MNTASTSVPERPAEAPTTSALAALSEREMAEIVEFVQARSLEDTVRAMPPEVVAHYDVGLGRIGPATAMAIRRVDVPMLNRIVGLGLAEPVTDETIDRIYELYGRAKVRFMVQMSPAALTEELHARLEARGLPRKDNWVNLIRGIEPPPEIRTDLRIEQIGREHAEGFADVICVAFELPREYGVLLTPLVGRAGWRHYLGFDGETAVAAGALYVHDQVGLLAMAGTLPSHRRRGGQGALITRRLREAAALGCRWLVIETFLDTPEHPNPSFHNMLRTGFQVAYERPNYIFFPE